MTTPHKHQATINAWAAGAQIQWRVHDSAVWEDADYPAWSPNYQYRVKHPHQALIDAHEAGEIIEVDHGAYWSVVFEPEWRPGLNYRVSPRSAELKELIAAHRAGKQIQRKNSSGWVDTVPTWSSMFEYRIKDKFADLKKAFSAGNLIESFNTDLGQFCVNLSPLWDEAVEYRLCPRQDELKPVIAAHLEGKLIEFHERGVGFGWYECVVAPRWQASHDYRIKTRWQKELDALRAGKKIEAKFTDRWDTWQVQISAGLDQILQHDSAPCLEFRVYDEYRTLKKAEAAGKVIELKTSSGRWEALASPCAWLWPAEAYRISPRSDELRPIIDGFGSGKTVQHRCGQSWVDCRLPRFYADQDYRLKPVWEKELDAYLAGETIQCGTTGMWVDQMRSAALEQELKDGRLGLKFRIKHKHQDCIDAFGKGKQVQWRRSAAEAWKDCCVSSWSLNLEYRVKPETVRSRRYLMRRTTGEVCVSLINTDTGYDPSKASYFVRWIDEDWVETEA